MDSTASDHKEDEKFSMSDQQTLTDDDTSESDQDENLQRTKHVDEGCDSGNLLYKNTSSFRCLAQILLSSSSLMKNRLYLFPPLDDPGIDEAFNYEEPHLNVDEIGIEKYVNLCKELRIVPITRVKKSLEGPELNLRFYGLTAKQLRAVTDTLKLNSYVEVLDLQDNFLDPYMTGLVSSMLEENTSLRIVRMRQCRIGVKGAEKFNDALSGSQFLTELDLSFNKLGDEGLKCLQQGLSETQSMRRLNIGHNDLTEVSVETLEKMLNENKTLNDINLSWNNFSTGPGNKRLFNAFLQNDRIKNLNMAWNGISLRAALTPIVKFVKNSETLERLDLSNNRITGKPSRKLRTAISKNHSLVEVRVGSNPITPVDALFIASVLALPEKANEPLEHLDMENIYFNKEVVPIQSFSHFRVNEHRFYISQKYSLTWKNVVERSLRQVLEASNDLYTRIAQTGAKDIQANLLLGSKGVDLPKIAQKLESISTKRTFEPIQPVEDFDINSILENETRNKILATFDSGYNEMLAFTYDTAWEHQNAEWKQEKRKILGAMSSNSGAAIEVSKELTLPSVRPEIALGNLGPIETIYVSKIIDYNKTVNRGVQKPNLVNIFAGLSNEFKDAKISDMWEIVKYMVQLPPSPEGDDPIKTRNSKTFIEASVKQGKRYLEDRYKTYMNNIINENLVQAIRGGIPGTYHLVRSFVGLRLQGEYLGLQNGLIDDRPLWPMVYYCLRSGDLSAAIYCLKKNGSPEFQELITLLEAKLNNLPSSEITKLEDVLKVSYRRVVRNDTDPFKRIIWSVLGCCDVSDEHSEVARTADDYLWLKLGLVRVDSYKDDHVKYNDLQRLISEEYGETHYDAFNQQHLYFQVLALTGQFEAAFEFLSRTEKFRVHAVHMAIALNELYLLGGPQDSNSPLLSIDPMDEKPACRLNLARLIMLYVRKFELTCPNEALNYFFFLRNYTDSEEQNLFKVCVSYLAIETKQYETILGRIHRNGVRTKGLIDQFTNANITAESIAQLIGENLVRKGLYEEAIDLFDIGNIQEEVLKLLCGILSRTAHLEIEPDSLRTRMQEKAMAFAERYSREGYKTTPGIVNTFLKLKDLLTFFDQYHAKQYSQAMKTLNDLQLVPLRPEDIDDRVKNFKNLQPDVCKVIPDVLLASMNMLFAQYQKIKSNNEYIPRFHDETMGKQLSYLREQAKCLTNFTGMLPYRMPGDTNSRLVQMEILMH
ncbi:hypothetical protein JTB14_000740 [Gonioctena quinquepunctata]|nr:hypothetical protein JTB14_000740 [Gonioctena quinquepunctata]